MVALMDIGLVSVDRIPPEALCACWSLHCCPKKMKYSRASRGGAGNPLFAQQDLRFMGASSQRLWDSCGARMEPKRCLPVIFCDEHENQNKFCWDDKADNDIKMRGILLWSNATPSLFMLKNIPSDAIAKLIYVKIMHWWRTHLFKNHDGTVFIRD